MVHVSVTRADELGQTFQERVAPEQHVGRFLPCLLCSLFLKLSWKEIPEREKEVEKELSSNISL